jgi:predicted lipoprotein with Yx(FWY)xxD motif
MSTFLGGERASKSAVEEFAPLSTPPGITLVHMMDEQSSSQPIYVVTRLGTEIGEPLYVPDSDELGTWSCTQQCADNYTPFLASSNAQGVGVWSLGKVEGEQNQWLYEDKPLFRRIKQPETGEGGPESQGSPAFQGHPQVSETAIPSASEDLQLLENAVEGGEGLTLALYEPGRHLLRPPSIMVKELPVAGGHVLVTTDRMTTYFFIGDSDVDQRVCGEEPCFASWTAVEAPMMARSIGDFAPVRRPNGVVQWAYAGKPLYTFRGDFAPGQANGVSKSEYWKVALLTRDYRPPNVVVAEVAGHGYFLASAGGKPLYNRLPFRYRFGGRNSYEGFIHNPYEEGKQLGTDGCDSECLKTWKPFLAPPGAQAVGYWEVFERADNTKQWAYQGYALYTNVLDEGPETITGNNLYEPLIGMSARYALADGVAHHGPGKAAGLTWHLAKH